MNKKKERKIRLTYIGRRTYGSVTRHCFLYGKRELAWAGVSGVRIGYVYSATKDDKTFGLKVRCPEELGEADVSPEKIKGWEAADLIAESNRKRRLAVKKAKRHPRLKEAAQMLRPLLDEVGFWYHRDLVEAMLQKARDLK